MKTTCSFPYSPIQCENKYKNMLKKRNTARKRNRVSGSEKNDIEFEDEFESINSIDDNIEPEVRLGIGQSSMKRTKLSNSSNEGDERKTYKPQNMFALVQNLHNDKEKEKERRHKEKIEVLRELFSKNT